MFVFKETCRCPKKLHTNYWSTPPYLEVNQKNKKIEGIFGGIIKEMVQTACGHCPAHGNTIIDISTNGKGERSAKKGVLQVLSDIDEVPQISFPIYGNKYITKYLGDYAYINLVESPGVAFIAATKAPGHAAINIVNAALDTVPLMIMSACMAFISGFIIWLMVSPKHQNVLVCLFVCVED